MQFKYNYLFFNWPDAPYGNIDKDGFNNISFRDFNKLQNVFINTAPLDHFPYFVRWLFHTYQKLHLPDRLLYRYFCNDCFENDNKLCLLFVRLPELSYMRWLRKKYTQAKFVVFLRDLYDNKHPLVDNYRCEQLVDLWITYDASDAQKYNMEFHPEVESKIDTSIIDTSFHQDVFFAGKAKNRLKEIIAIYDKLTNAGLKCLFYVMRADYNESDKRDGIIFSNRMMKYKEVLTHSLQSKCILEINQEGAIGNTCRFLESVMYNRKLLTNNTSLKNDIFYNPEYISFWETPEQIDTDFIKNDTVVDFKYNNEFSPIDLLTFIENKLN